MTLLPNKLQITIQCLLAYIKMINIDSEITLSIIFLVHHHVAPKMVTQYPGQVAKDICPSYFIISIVNCSSSVIISIIERSSYFIISYVK